MSEHIIEVSHLSKSFGTHVVLRDVDFTVNPGDVTCVIGSSGSGKSTLLRCINLLETPTHGSVLFHGKEITSKGFDPCAYRAKVGMVFQSFNLFNNMTVLDNCTAGLRCAGQSGKGGHGPLHRRQAAPAFRRAEAARGHRPRPVDAARSAAV